MSDLIIVWFLVGYGGMGYGDYCWGLLQGSIPPFPTKHQTDKVPNYLVPSALTLEFN